MGCHEHLPYSGKLLREKTFMNFSGFEAVFSTKFGDVVTFGVAHT